MFKAKISTEEIAQLPLVAFPGTISVIDAIDDSFFAAIRYLERQKIIGFDTETRPCFIASQPHYNVSLLQLSGSAKSFLFRLNHIGLPQKLVHVLATPKIVKVGAAVRDDIRGLQKLRQFRDASFVDLQSMVGEYGIEDKSVKKMSAIILDARISKSQQCSNWEADVLTDAQALYAATDAWICREMYNKLKAYDQNNTPQRP